MIVEPKDRQFKQSLKTNDLPLARRRLREADCQFRNKSLLQRTGIADNSLPPNHCGCILILPPDCSPERVRGRSYIVGDSKGREQARGYNQPTGYGRCR